MATSPFSLWQPFLQIQLLLLEKAQNPLESEKAEYLLNAFQNFQAFLEGFGSHLLMINLSKREVTYSEMEEEFKKIEDDYQEMKNFLEENKTRIKGVEYLQGCLGLNDTEVCFCFTPLQDVSPGTIKENSGSTPLSLRVSVDFIDAS